MYAVRAQLSSAVFINFDTVFSIFSSRKIWKKIQLLLFIKKKKRAYGLQNVYNKKDGLYFSKPGNR